MLDRVRTLCLSFPEAEEKLSHGAPSWFVRKGRQFAIFQDDHHYFVPPSVGHRGWVGVRLDRDLPWDDVAGALEDAYCEVAPPRLLDRVRPVAGP